VDYGLETTSHRNGSLQITGGEPAISDRLPVLLDRLRQHPHRFHRVVFNTNGTGWRSSLQEQLAAAGVTHLNLSRHHYRDSENRRIMQSLGVPNRGQIPGIVQAARDAGIDTRLNCNLLAEGINNFSQLRRMSKWARRQGIERIAFSQTFPLSLFPHNITHTPGYTESQQVDLFLIVRELDANAKPITRRAVCSSWGESRWGRANEGPGLPGGKCRLWTLDGATISVKVLAGYDVFGLPLPSNTYADVELHEFAVVHPDGVVSESWNKRKKILYDPRSAEVTQMAGVLVKENRG
jgi:hypothetical protein